MTKPDSGRWGVSAPVKVPGSKNWYRVTLDFYVEADDEEQAWGRAWGIQQALAVTNVAGAINGYLQPDEFRWDVHE
jgi:hypothetical protein